MKPVDYYDRALSGLRRINGIATLLEIAGQSPEPIPEQSLQEAAGIIREKAEEVEGHLRDLHNSVSRAAKN